MSYDVVIIGAGAAGLMCAAEAGKRGHKVLLLEHNKVVGRKILISGGGRCNFTNRIVESQNFFSQNRHFSKSALSHYIPSDFVELLEQYQIPFYEKTLGQLFCERSAKDVIKVLLSECEKGAVEIKTETEVKSIEEGFLIKTNRGEYKSEKLVIATGGLSISQIGASDFGYRLARNFGLKVTETRPALVPFTLKGFDELSGVSLPCQIKTGKTSFKEALLFTHKGLSGPAVLQISLYWNPGEEVFVDFLPGKSLQQILERKKREEGKQSVFKALKDFFPARFLEKFIEISLEHPDIELANQKKKELEKLISNLSNWRIIPDGVEGYRKAEVTRGGVSTSELNSKTMETKKVPGLYFIGEVVDVTGWLGGYNFQWAWASGYAAAKAL